MSFSNDGELARLAARNDVYLSASRTARGGVWNRLYHAASSVAFFGLATVLSSLLVFLPIMVLALMRIEAVEIEGERIPVDMFLEQSATLYFGSLVIAFVFTCFFAGVRLAAPPLDQHIKHNPNSSEGTLFHLAVIRLLRMER